MKKIFLLVITITMLGVVGCSSANSSDKKESSDTPKKEAIVLTDEEQDKALETINFMCEGTAYDKSIIKLESEQHDQGLRIDNVLQVSVIKDRSEVETYFRLEGAGDTVEDSIKKALTLDTAVSAATEDLNKINEFDKIIAVLYSSEEDYKNDNSYLVDTLEID
ncbi:MAG: hypothetical protein DBY38_02200 [Clostridium cadaveris]|uniref:Lipoprotein n=1 Tax=Clostridium cadaveris TaxID=1529 RepID=A0A316MFK8_9CLOT|nr:MAG: hypothetical protein DBY38_02200 [Clostridium cadaveris]